MDNFNTKRFANVLKWTFYDSKKELVTTAACMFFLFMMFFIINLLATHDSSNTMAAKNLHSMVATCIGAYSIFAVISGTYILKNMKTKEQRIRFKMLPASNLEKFIARMLYTTAGLWLAAFLAFCAADIARTLISLMIGTHWEGLTIGDFTTGLFSGMFTSMRVDQSEISECDITISGAAWFFFIHSCYVLGGTFFRRNQFILTSGVLFLATVIVASVSLSNAPGIYMSISDESARNVIYTVTAAFIIIGLLNWWLSYRLFKRMQIICNKWINV